MYILNGITIIVRFLLLTILIIEPVITVDVCTNQQCKCSPSLTTVHCDTKQWNNLDDIDFPSKVVKLTLVNNNLKFDTGKNE
jgi:hypothetical protein